MRSGHTLTVFVDAGQQSPTLARSFSSPPPVSHSRTFPLSVSLSMSLFLALSIALFLQLSCLFLWPTLSLLNIDMCILYICIHMCVYTYVYSYIYIYIYKRRGVTVTDSEPLDGASAHDPEFQMFIDRNDSHYNSSLFFHESLVSSHVPRLYHSCWLVYGVGDSYWTSCPIIPADDHTE